jgi:hypothetical protein
MKGEFEEIQSGGQQLENFSRNLDRKNPRAVEQFNEMANTWIRGRLENLNNFARYSQNARSYNLSPDESISATKFLPEEIAKITDRIISLSENQ